MMGQGQRVDYGLEIDDIKRSDPKAKEIIDTAHDVAIFTCNHDTKVWTKTFRQASVIVYSRNVEPNHVLWVLDSDFQGEEIVLLTAEKEFHIDGPFLFYRDELARMCNSNFIFTRTFRLYKIFRSTGMRCFEFESETDCNRIGTRIQQILQPIHLVSQQMTRYVGLLSMLAEEQGLFDNSEQPNQLNEAIRTRLAPSVLRVFNGGNIETQPGRDEESSTAPLCERVTVESTEEQTNYFDAGNLVMDHVLHQANRSVPSLLRTTVSASSSAMSIFDALNAVMTDDTYPVTTIPSYPTVTPESAQLISFSKVPVHAKKRTLPPLSHFDQIEKRQKLAASQLQNTDILEHSKSTYRQARETGSSATMPSSHPTTLNNTCPARPKLCSPLMFNERKQSPNKTVTFAQLKPTKNISSVVIQKNESERYGQPSSLTQQPAKSSSLELVERKQLTNETVPSTQQTETENISSGVLRVNKLVEPYGKPEPLTQTQLLQAVSHLMKSDNGFVHKLHEAYLESFVDTLRKTE